MINKSVFENDLISGMQRELQSYEKKQGMQSLVKAAEYLHAAEEIFEETGLTDKADQILKILAKIALDNNDVKHHQNKDFYDKVLKWMKDPQDPSGEEVEISSLIKDQGSHKKEKSNDEFAFESLLSDDNEVKNKSDRHTKGLTSEKMIKNLKEHGVVFNMADDNLSDDLLNAEIGNEPLNNDMEDSEELFEDSH